MKLGFIGLGSMGKGMALNLAKHGADLFVYARRPEVLTDFQALNIPTTTALQDMAVVDVLFFCVPNEKTVEAMLFGEHGLAPLLKAGQIIVDCSTISYLAAKDIAGRLAQQSVGYLDAPVSGMEHKALAGTLTIMCGGDKALYDRVEPLLHFMGTNILYMGPSGCGQLSKLVNNVLYNINMAAVAEIVPMAVKLGLDAEQIAGIINTSTGRSHASEFFLPEILKGNFMGTYPMQSAYKDMCCASEVAARECIPVPVLHAAVTTYQEAMLQGYGACGKGAMIRLYETLNGVEVRAKEQE